MSWLLIMYTNLKNLSEFVLWASASCGLAFFVRIVPAFWFPILMLRIGFSLFCLYNIFNAPRKSVKFSFCFIGGAVIFGMLGGYWDYFEVIVKYQQGDIVAILTFISVLLTLFFTVQYWILSHDKN